MYKRQVLNVGHSVFITLNSDWGSLSDASGSTRQDNWDKLDGSSVCPSGFRVPSISELTAELYETGADISSNTPNTDKRINAFESFLKLPSSGNRDRTSGNLTSTENIGILWSNTVNISTVFVDRAGWDASGKITAAVVTTNGYNVRCIDNGGLR